MFSQSVVSIVCSLAAPQACADFNTLMRNATAAVQPRDSTGGRTATSAYGRDASLADRSAAPSLAIDFDGDGASDRVVLERNGPGGRLVAYRAIAPDRGIVVSEVRDSRDLFLSTIAAGTYPTACGKGLGPAAACTTTSVTFERATIGFGTSEASLFAAAWNGRGFAITTLSD